MVLRPLILLLLLGGTLGSLLPQPRRVHRPQVPYALEPLPWGSVLPQGWLNDWATAARHGAASPERAAFAHVQPFPHGAPKAGQPGCSVVGGQLCERVDGWKTGRPASDGFWDEDSAYWIDGMARLGFVLGDATLQRRVAEDIEAVLANPVYFHNTWVTRTDLGDGSAEGWVRSVYSRAMLAYYDGTGDTKLLRFLETAFANYTAADSTSDRSLTQLEALLEGHAYGGPVSMRDTALKMLDANPVAQQALVVLLSGCTDNSTAVALGECQVPFEHGVSFNEISKVFAMAYSWNANKTLLRASENAFAMLRRFHTQVHGVNSADEQLNGISPNLGTETCDVSDFSYSNQWMLRITGESKYADSSERAVLNAGPGAVNRSFMAHLYYQSPNLIASSPGFAWFDGPGNETACNDDAADHNCRSSRWSFGHFHLPPCCTGNQARMLPNFIHHTSFGLSRPEGKGVAIASYVPSRVSLRVGQGTPVTIQVLTAYPFEESVVLNVSKLAQPSAFAVLLRIPGWCAQVSAQVNRQPITALVGGASGFANITRVWSQADTVKLLLPMPIRATLEYTFANGNQNATFDRNHPWTGQNSTPGLPYCVVQAGPLTFALPLESSHGLGAANYAIDCDATTMVLHRNPLVQPFDWPLAAPMRIVVAAQMFTWPDVWRLPDAPIKRSPGQLHPLTLVPYGSAKQFHVSMFPVLEPT